MVIEIYDPLKNTEVSLLEFKTSVFLDIPNRKYDDPFDEENNNVSIPVYFDGELIGWQEDSYSNNGRGKLTESSFRPNDDIEVRYV